MGDHRATVRWASSGGEFAKGRYSREHTWTFDGGQTVLASASPSIVPVPLSNPAGVDPEEAFVASLSSCHLLTFLDLARRAGFEVTAYEDDALGTLTKTESGVRWISRVLLRPKVTYGGARPVAEDERRFHAEAHHYCFIANSVKTEIVIEPRGD